MSQLVLVLFGGAAATTGVLVLVRRWPGEWTSFAVSMLASALLGVYEATGPHPRTAWAFIAVGLLGTAASLVFVIGNPAPPARNWAAERSFLLTVMRVIVTKALLCAVFAAAGYLSGDLVLLAIIKVQLLNA